MKDTTGQKIARNVRSANNHELVLIRGLAANAQPVGKRVMKDTTGLRIVRSAPYAEKKDPEFMSGADANVAYVE